MRDTMSFMAMVELAMTILTKWQVLASIGGVLLVWLLLRTIADPRERQPRVAMPRPRRAPKAAPPPQADDEEAEEEDEEYRPRRRAAGDFDEE